MQLRHQPPVLSQTFVQGNTITGNSQLDAMNTAAPYYARLRGQRPCGCVRCRAGRRLVRWGKRLGG